MKNNIEFFYNLPVNQLKEYDQYYSFISNNSKYYFLLNTRPIEDLKEISAIVLELHEKNIAVHSFILNKDQKLLTTINEKNYLLLKINTSDTLELDLIDIVNFQNQLILKSENNKLYRNDWAGLWSEKIDYFEYQIRQLGKEKQVVLNSFSYYIGLSENAISYVNHINETTKKEFTLTLAHKRLFSPTLAINFYNPLTFIFDLKVRDIAEYLKSAFFNDENPLIELTNYLKNNYLTVYEYKMLYARLLYPSYYFDIYEQIMNRNKDENELIKIISKVFDYELFLKDVYNLLSQYTYLDKIDWLN